MLPGCFNSLPSYFLLLLIYYRLRHLPSDFAPMLLFDENWGSSLCLAQLFHLSGGDTIFGVSSLPVPFIGSRRHSYSSHLMRTGVCLTRPICRALAYSSVSLWTIPNQELSPIPFLKFEPSLRLKHSGSFEYPLGVVSS